MFRIANRAILLSLSGQSRRLRNRAVILCLVSVLPASCLDAHQKRPAKPSNTFDFGTIREGQTIDHTFELYNPSLKPVNVIAVKSSCGCTVLQSWPATIEPHSSALFPAQFRSHGRSGNVSSAILVHLEDDKIATFTFHGFVVGNSISPIDFGSILRNNSTKRHTLFPVPPDLDLKISSLDYNRERFDVTYSISEQYPRNVLVAVLPKTTIPFGPFEEALSIKTDDPAGAEKNVLLRGYVLYPLEIEPSEVTLGVLRPGVETSAVVRLYSPYDYPVSITSVAIEEGDAIAWTLSPESPTSTAMKLTVLPPLAPTGRTYKTVLAIEGAAGEHIRKVYVEVLGLTGLASAKGAP